MKKLFSKNIPFKARLLLIFLAIITVGTVFVYKTIKSQNTYAVDPLEVIYSGNTTPDPIFAIDDMKPGDTYLRCFTVKNKSDEIFSVDMAGILIMEQKNFTQILDFKVYDPETSESYFAGIAADFFSNSPFDLGNISAESERNLCGEVYFPETAGNEYQEAVVNFDLKFSTNLPDIDIPPECLHLEFTNVIMGTSGNDHLTGTTGNDLILAYGGNNRIRGASGDDCIVAGNGNNDINSGTGNDVVIVGNGNNQIDGSAGDDHIYAGDGNNRIEGGSGNDVIEVGNGNNKIEGNSGDDTLKTGDGNNVVNGDAGNDYILTGDGKDVIRGGAGDDEIYAGGNTDIVFGNSGGDQIFGENGDDELSGNVGDDFIDGGLGLDKIKGGTGIDTCINGFSYASCEL